MSHLLSLRKFLPIAWLMGFFFGSSLHADSTLEISTEFNPDPIEPGELLDAQISIANPTVGSSGELVLKVLWPEQIYISPVITGGGACPGNCDPGEYLVWDEADLGSLPSGAALSVSFNETIRSDVADGTEVPFEIQLFEGGVLAREISHSVVVNGQSPLELVVDPLSDPVAPGDTLLYELTYGNNGNAVSSNTLLQFSVPEGSTFVSASGTGTHTDSIVTWILDNLSAHSNGREWVTVQVADDLANGSLLEVDQARLAGTLNTVDAQSWAIAVSRVDEAEPLKLSAQFNPDPVEPAELLDAQITIANPTAGPSGELLLRVLWPEQIYISPVVTGGGDCPGNCDPGEYLVWDETDLGSLPPGATFRVGFNETIRSDVAGGTVIPFKVQLFEGGVLAREISHSVVVNGQSPLEMVVSPLSDPAAPGDTLLYMLTYGNNGNDVSSNTLLQFPVPEESTFVAASGNGMQAEGVVTWALDYLSPHSGGRAWVAVKVADDLVNGSLLEVASARLAGTTSSVDMQSWAMAVSRVHDAAPLQLSAQFSPDPVEPEDLLDAQISIVNPTAGPSGELGLRVLWPEQIYVSPVVTGGGDCPGNCDPGEYLIWDETDLGSLPSGATFRVGFNETIRSDAVDGTVIPFKMQLFEGDDLAREINNGILVGNDQTSLQPWESVQDVYIAYYGRPGDPAGVNWWADQLSQSGGNLDAIIQQFGTSQEFVTEYGNLPNSELIDTIYQQMFCREPDLDGKTFYLGRLDSGEMTLPSIALDVLNGAQNEDAVIIANKRIVAAYFTAQVELLGLGYEADDIAAARSSLNVVCGQVGDLEAGFAQADEVLGGM